MINNKLPLWSWKARRFLVVPLLLTVRPIVTCGSRVSPAPPHHTLPAFQNLHGILYLVKIINCICEWNFHEYDGSLSVSTFLSLSLSILRHLVFHLAIFASRKYYFCEILVARSCLDWQEGNSIRRRTSLWGPKSQINGRNDKSLLFCFHYNCCNSPLKLTHRRPKIISNTTG